MADLSALSQLGTAAPAAQPAAPVHVQKLDKLGRAYATGKKGGISKGELADDRELVGGPLLGLLRY